MKSAWQVVSQTTIYNTFRTAGFVYPNTQGETSTTMNNNGDNDFDDEITTDDVSTALQNLDTLLAHINIGGHCLTANEFIEIDSETPAFNDWNDINDDLIVVDEDCSGNITTDNNEDGDMPSETPSKLTEAMKMV
ncbi:unnamed protein product [Rotaria sp. Silwood2]|nr:unnamed protein product [Rotaria sp. Silwood2]CAF2559063.1 unnamed protein product [Rotaria sp. Silwood2]CAF2820320.1 unnamed protein product [Rotaria sp. Silwood2]CAF2981638.1 unnamed protein product [Rotaria sp. Silwood2]CAF4257628.1 unnamed protein product [Rotaria sp. Silwood2]